MKYLCCILSIFLLAAAEIETSGASLDMQEFLHEFNGEWRGEGFTMIAVPRTKPPHDFELKLFNTVETLIFGGVRDGIRNARNTDETFLSSLSYYQAVYDKNYPFTELHTEAGMWMFAPAVGTSAQELWRAGVVPHGNAFLAGSILDEVLDQKKPPVFEEMDTRPFTQFFEDDLKTGPYVDPYETPVLPDSMIPRYTTDIVLNPPNFLKKDNEGLNIVSTKTISISSPLQHEANASRIEAKFYIEKVKTDAGTFYYQLQYVQEIYIDFRVFDKDPILTWPHVSVATLRKHTGEFTD